MLLHYIYNMIINPHLIKCHDVMRLMRRRSNASYEQARYHSHAGLDASARQPRTELSATKLLFCLASYSWRRLKAGKESSSILNGSIGPWHSAFLWQTAWFLWVWYRGKSNGYITWKSNGLSPCSPPKFSQLTAPRARTLLIHSRNLSRHSRKTCTKPPLICPLRTVKLTVNVS